MRIKFDELLEKISVMAPGMFEAGETYIPKDWYAVSTDDGIVAYFYHEEDAHAFRLWLINSYLNARNLEGSDVF